MSTMVVRLSNPLSATSAERIGLSPVRAYAVNEDITVDSRVGKSLIQQGIARASDGTPDPDPDPTPPPSGSVLDVVGQVGHVTAAQIVTAVSGLLAFVPNSAKGTANGVATLDSSGVLPAGQLPPLALTDVTPVASQSAMLALAAQKGDVAVRTDTNQWFMLASNSPSTLADWKELQAVGAIASVNGKTGVVVLNAADVGAVPLSRVIATTDGSLSGGGALSANLTLAVVPNTTTQRVEVARAGTLVAARKRVNLVPGTNVTITTADNSGTDSVDVTIASTASSGVPSDQANAAVLWTPSDATGATDMTSELESFRAAHLGKMVQVKQGSIVRLNNAFAAVNTGDILLDFSGCTVVYDNNATSGYAIVCDNTSNASIEAGVTAVALAAVNSNVYTTRLTLDTSLVAAPFDWLAVYSADANPARTGGVLGEIVQVLNAESSLQVALTRKLNRHDKYLTSIKARKLNASRKVVIRGGVFKANGNTQLTSVTTRAAAILIAGYVRPEVEGVKFDHPWGTGVRFIACAAPQWRGVSLQDVGNLGAYGAVQAAVALYGMNDQADGRGMVVSNGRSAAFVTEGDGSSTATWWKKGIPTNFSVDGVHGFNVHGDVINIGPEGDSGILSNVVASYAYQDAIAFGGGGYVGTGVTLRGANMTLRNAEIVGGIRGVRIPAVDHGFEDRIRLTNVSVRSTTHATDGDSGIYIDDMSTITNPRHVIFRGEIEDTGTAFVVGRNARLSIAHVAARRCKVFMDAGAGADVVVEDSVLDYRSPTRTAPFSCVLARSDAAIGGCSVVFLNSPIMLKGASGPATFVTESDTAANKRLWVPDPRVFDPKTTGAPSVLATGASTFDPANVVVVPGYFVDNDPGQPIDQPVPNTIQDLLPGLAKFKVTLPTGSGPDEIFQPQLATYTSTYVHLNTAKDAVVFYAPIAGTTTDNSQYTRTELREMTGSDGLTQAAWGSNDGQSHTQTVTQSIDHLPDKRPLVVFDQVHAAGAASFLLLVADGFRPTTGTTAVTGSSTSAFTLMYKVNDSSSAQVEYAPILTNYRLGQTFTTKIEVAAGVVKIYCDLGTTATTLRATITDNVPSTGLYFKTGTYNQSALDNSTKTVPAGTCASGADLTSPAAGTTVANEASTAYSQTSIKALSVVHATYGGGPILDTAKPSDVLDLSKWKLTRPDASEILQPDLTGYSDVNFKVNKVTGGVVFRATCGGLPTKTSNYPRCELREMTGSDGKTQMYWSKSSGTHTMLATFAIIELPVVKPQTVAGQIHDDGDDWLEVLADGQRPNGGGAFVTGRMSTRPFALAYRFHGAEQSTNLLADYVMGDKVSLKVVCTGGAYSVWLQRGTSLTFSGSPIATHTITGQTGPGYYFKMGDYTQSNTAKGDASTAAGEVEVYALSITHV